MRLNNYWVIRKARADFFVSGVKTDLNISERLKITCVPIVKDDTSGILGKKFDCDMLIFVSFIRL